MNYPPRLGHLVTRKVVAAKLAPTYALSHNLEEGEAVAALERALEGSLWEALLAASWQALVEKNRKLDEERLLEKVATTLKDRPHKPGAAAAMTPAWSAFLVKLDLEAGTASDMARRVLESPEGARRVEEGLRDAGQHLARELTRK